MDTARTQDEKEYLAELRRPAAQQFWESADIPRVMESDSWDEDGRFWCRTVYWENDEGPSTIGSFGLEFGEDSTDLVKIAGIFAESMEKRKLLPKNPWKAKRVEQWLNKMGARMVPGSTYMSPWQPVDCKNYVNFRVYCLPSKHKIKGRRGSRYIRIEIPHELADKILVLGHLP